MTTTLWLDNALPRFLFLVLFVTLCLTFAQAEEGDDPDLPFNREQINRYSLDHLPRSISIRQGDDFWLGYDLQRATLYKAWQAPEHQSGLKPNGFVMRSVGRTLFEDKSDETWQLMHDGKIQSLTIRYLGCSQREGYFELRWELAYGSGVLNLRERAPLTAEEPVVRQIRVDALPSGMQLLLPRLAGQGWRLTDARGSTELGLTDAQWYQLTLR